MRYTFYRSIRIYEEKFELSENPLYMHHPLKDFFLYKKTDIYLKIRLCKLSFLKQNFEYLCFTISFNSKRVDFF